MTDTNLFRCDGRRSHRAIEAPKRSLTGRDKDSRCRPAGNRPDFAADSGIPLRGAPYGPAMLRLTDIKLPLNHPPEALKAAILKLLKIGPAALLHFTVVKRGHDARKKANILSVYTVDAQVADEPSLLARLKDPHVRPAPDMAYKFVARRAQAFYAGRW